MNSAAQGYGSFQLGGMNLALPIDNLREVLACHALVDLPCAQAAVLGGIQLRGVCVPVLDLRILLGRPVKRADADCIIIVSHQGYLLGLLADRVQGLFFASSEELHRMQFHGETPEIFMASVKYKAHELISHILNVQAIAQIPHLPMVKEPAHTWEQTENIEEEANPLPLMLMRSGKMAFAIDTTGVETTLVNAKLDKVDLKGDYFLGTLPYRGMNIPAIELCRLCGLPKPESSEHLQAFVVRTAQGPVAYMIESILEIVQSLHSHYGSLPQLNLPHPNIFTGALPNQSLPESVLKKIKPWGQQHLILNTQALAHLPEIVDLAKTYCQHNQADEDSSDLKSTSKERLKLITYWIGQDCATPIEQIAEVLPYRAEISLFDHDDALIGMLNNRGKSIPVFCLSRLISGRFDELDSRASVLIVRTENQDVGFAVPQLKSIEAGRMMPPVPLLSKHERPAYDDTQQSKPLAETGEGRETHMVSVLDLIKVANHVCGANRPRVACIT